MYKCEECNLEFDTFQAKANHHRWKHLKYVFKSKESKVKSSKKQSKSLLRYNEIIHGKWIDENIKCKCGNIFHIRYREGHKHKQFCSKQCANKYRIRSPKSRLKTSKAIKNAWKTGVYNTNSYNEKQSKNRKFSSKQEREIVNHFKMNFSKYEWKSGGRLIFNKENISRDLYSNKLKLCFEYDGVWHFKDIHNQLDKKRRKDKALEEWCKENDYRLIRVDENDYKDLNQIEKLFFERNDPIIKIGKRY
jgi:hypothetical protein